MTFSPKHQGERFKLMERGLLVTSDETKALGNLTGFRDDADLAWVMKALNEYDSLVAEVTRLRGYKCRQARGLTCYEKISKWTGKPIPETAS